MGIENLTKLEANEDGTYTATCNNKCETEIVSKKDVAIGAVCEKKYSDLDGSIIPVGHSLEFTAFGYGHDSWTTDLDECLDETAIREKYAIERLNKFHHVLKRQRGEIKDCLKNYKPNAMYEYVSFSYEMILRITIQDGRIIRMKMHDGEDWYHCIDGHYDDPNILKLELRKRWLKKQQAEIS